MTGICLEARDFDDVRPWDGDGALAADELASLTDDELLDRYSQALRMWSATTAGSSSRVSMFVRFVLMEKVLSHRLERTLGKRDLVAGEPG